ncbi:MAG: discoidin domain-containing protein [Bacteroidaceae bacterium]|nr:discoidin domain-containing protein [Bacteroidaceae bacterium]
MRKLYYFLTLLLPLATMMLSGNAYAQDPDKALYDAAMAAIVDGDTYYIATEVNGRMFYVTLAGALTSDEDNAGLFTFQKTSGGALYDVGINIEGGTGNHFSNSTLENNKCKLDYGSYRQDGSNNRNDWERQVFYMNEEGKFAIRSCNTAYGESSWADAGRAFWTYEVEDVMDAEPVPCYSYEPAFVWQLTKPSIQSQIYNTLNGIYIDYENYVFDSGEGETMNIGQGFGQLSDVDTWKKFFALLQQVATYVDNILNGVYNYPDDPNAPTLEMATAMKEEADSLYQVLLDSEVPYALPQNGYYRIIANLRYKTSDGYVDKAILGSIDPEHENKGMYGTIKRDRANFLWKLTQDNDSIIMQNAGLETFISFSSPAEGRMILTDAENDRSHVVFDYAGEDYVEGDNGNGEMKDIFYIRLANQPRHSDKYVHQLGHNRGSDSGADLELGFWNGTYTYGAPYDSDKGTSEWYLEYVPEAEAEALIAEFQGGTLAHDQLVLNNNTLRAQVLAVITDTQDPIKTNLITSAEQFYSPYSQNDCGDRDGGDLSAGVLIDGQPGTFWHSVWSGTDIGGEFHYLQISDMDEMIGDCQLYMLRRAATNDHPTVIRVFGADDQGVAENPEMAEGGWEEMFTLNVPNGESGLEATVNFHVDKAHKYIRLGVVDCAPSYRRYWHSAEIQISSLKENPNSRFNAMGDLGPALVAAYEANLAIADADLTDADYQALLNAYNAFYGPIENHNELVEMNAELRAEVMAALEEAKDVKRTAMITSADQLSSPYSDSAEGQHIEYLIDGDAGTFWHTDWHGEHPDDATHWLQIADMGEFVGDCEFYIYQRATDNDHPSKITLLGSDDPEAADEDWTEMATLTIQNAASGGVYTTPLFNIEQPYENVRLVVTECQPSFRIYWHAAEIQFYTVRENPNSQYVTLGEISKTLEDTYNANLAIEDNDITFAVYTELLNAYNAFLAALVDPAELRNALAAYANTTKGVVEGTQPGQWPSTDIATAYDKLYNEAKAYDAAGKYTAAKSHKYAVMLKTMAKSVMEQAAGIKTDTWYRFMFPTEEMFDAYGLDKSGGSPVSNIESQPYQWGNYVVAGEMIYEDDKLVDVEPLTADDIREDAGMYFIDDEMISDKDASLFRFVAKQEAESDYSGIFTELKENMVLALDMNASYTQGEGLITDAAQFSSNASYPGNDGQKLESGCLIDGDFSTYWHSDYSKEFCVVPYLQVALNEPASGLIQLYVGRRNTSNGHVVRMYVQGSNDAENWTNIGYVETPFTNASTPATSQPIDLGGSYSHLRFTMTNRYGTDGGGNVEFDPFAEGLTADDYNTKFTYFHASEFQIYPVTVNDQSASEKALQQAYTTANKVVLKDATADDFAAASQAYKAYQTEYNAAEGMAVLPNGADKPTVQYAIQNKGTGLFVNAKAANNNDVLFKLVPTFFDYKVLGYERSLLHGKNIDGTDITYLHSQNWNHRLVTWNANAAHSNSGLIIREAGPVEDLSGFSFWKEIKPGRIYNWCNSVSITNQGEGVAYSPVGRYTTDAGAFLALKKIETIPAGEPAFYIFGDTVAYNTEKEAEPMQFTMPAEPELAVEGKNVNGVIGCLVNHTLKEHEIYFSGNQAKCIGQTGYYISGNSAVLDIFSCPEVDANGSYDFSIFLGEAATEALGIENVTAAIQKISQPGNVYSMDGKLLRTGATLNSLKSLGKGMYILNGVKVLVK